MKRTSRRQFIGQMAAGSVATLGAAGAGDAVAAPRREYKISLAAWSLHKAFRANLITQMDIPRIARENFGIEAIELVNTFFPSPTERYLSQLSREARKHDVYIHLIMVDAEGPMAHTDAAVRRKAVKNHHKWVDMAATLGCRLIRCNMRGGGRRGSEPTDAAGISEFIKRSVDSFSSLIDYAKDANIGVVIENHGGLSSDPAVLTRVMEGVNSPHFGTLPDFGNFPDETDKYEAVRKLMRYAKAVSAKSREFDGDGNESTMDYEKLIGIVVDEAGYNGYIGIEYEGSKRSEYEGISATKALLDRLRA